MRMRPAGVDVDRLLADVQVGGDLSHGTTRGDQIKNLAEELRGR
jgi:hypothetical protein